MAIILLKIPDGTGKFIGGDSTLYGYEGLPLVVDVRYDISVKAETHLEGRRTVNLPDVSTVSITRSLDAATAQTTRLTLKGSVSGTPWELLFFRGAGATDATLSKFMSLKLHNALIHSQEIRAEAAGITETLMVGATKMEWDYTAYGPGQVPAGTFSFSYDMQLGSAT